jgi:hypothetical protein
MGCHAETHEANTFISIGLETRFRTVALLVHCRFDHGLGLYRLECRPMRKLPGFVSTRSTKPMCEPASTCNCWRGRRPRIDGTEIQAVLDLSSQIADALNAGTIRESYTAGRKVRTLLGRHGSGAALRSTCLPSRRLSVIRTQGHGLMSGTPDSPRRSVLDLLFFCRLLDDFLIDAVSIDQGREIFRFERVLAS